MCVLLIYLYVYYMNALITQFDISLSLSRLFSQALWFPLLEAMMSPQKFLKGPNAKDTSDGDTHTHTHSA